MVENRTKLALVNLLREAEREPALRDFFRSRRLHDVTRLSEKFIFDTGMDRDQDTVQAILETRNAMVEQGRFHLPYPITWIEDPFPDDFNHRRCYLCTERDNVITILAMEDFGRFLNGVLRYAAFDLPIYIDMNRDPRGSGFTYASYPIEMQETGVPPGIREMVGEVLYAVAKFIVVLAAKGTERERCQRAARGASSRRDNPKDWPYTVVRVPLDYSAPKAAWGGTHAPPRKHLVRGYQYGKFTRPLEKQRWVDPYWRGHEERGVIIHDHYEVG